MSFKDLDEAVIVDVKTDPEQDRVVAVVMMKVMFSEITRELLAPSGEEIKVDRMRATFSPDRPTSGCHDGMASDACDEHADGFSNDAPELRTFIGELPVIGHDVAATTAVLNREFGLAGVEALDGNRMYCTKARFTRDTPKVTDPSLREMAAALKPWRLVRSFAVDGMDQDTATMLLAACHFWAVDNHLTARPSDKAFRILLKVLAGTGLAWLIITKMLPLNIVLVLLLAFLYWLIPTPLFVALVVIIGVGGWLTWWAGKRTDEVEREESDQ